MGDSPKRKGIFQLTSEYTNCLVYNISNLWDMQTRGILRPICQALLRL